MCTVSVSPGRSVMWLRHAPVNRLNALLVWVHSACCVFPGLAGFRVNICTVQSHGPDIPSPLCTWAFWVEQGEIACVIFLVRSCPRYASPTSKYMTYCRHSALHSEIFNLDWFRHDNKLKHKDFTALCRLEKPLQTVQRPQGCSPGTQQFQAFTSHSPLSLLWSHQLKCKLLHTEGLYLLSFPQ